MSGHKNRINPFLLIIAVVLCLVCGVLFTRSSATPHPISEEHMPDVVLAEHSEQSDLNDTSPETSTTDTVIAEPSPTPEPTSVPAKEQKEEKKPAYTPSPEASEGVWTPSGSSWLFLVNGTAYKGWLYDVDEKVYYLNDSGIMVTGWNEIDGKQYYFNADGILQSDESPKTSKTEKADESSKSDQTEKDNKKEKADENSDADKKADKKTIALTFDDGPSSFTNRLLDCLEEHNVKATFFLVGYEIASFPDEVKRMEELGMEIGNHTAEHKDLTKLSADDISQQIETVNTQLTELIGHGAVVLRPPYGAVNDTVAQTANLPMILWSIDTLDWESLNAESIVDVVLSEVENGSIILMHDIYSSTVDAVEMLIPKLLEDNYELVTVHELAEKFNTDLESGITYSSFK